MDSCIMRNQVLPKGVWLILGILKIVSKSLSAIFIVFKEMDLLAFLLKEPDCCRVIMECVE